MTPIGNDTEVMRKRSRSYRLARKKGEESLVGITTVESHTTCINAFSPLL